MEERTSVEESLQEASRLADSGDAAEAFGVLLEVERDHPDDPTLLCMLGVLAAHHDAEGMSIDFFRRCLAQQPTDPELLVTAGAALAAAGDPDAEPALRLAAVTAPHLPAARMHYGALLVRNGLLEQGLEELRTARSLGPDDATIRRELALGMLMDRRGVEALGELEAAVAADPDDADMRFLFGLVLLHEDEPARAAEELHPIGSLLSDDAEVQLILALTFALAEWEEEAWLALSRAEGASDPADPAVVRDVEEAIEQGEEAVRPLLLEELAASALRDRVYRSF